MKSLRQHACVRRASVAILIAAATACTRRSDQPADAPPAAASATAASPDQQIPDNDSPFDALPEAVRLVAGQAVHRRLRRDGQAPRDSRGR